MEAFAQVLIETTRPEIEQLDEHSRRVALEAYLRGFTRLAIEFEPPATVADVLRDLLETINTG